MPRLRLGGYRPNVSKGIQMSCMQQVQERKGRQIQSSDEDRVQGGE
jgi:hypothetical protein